MTMKTITKVVKYLFLFLISTIIIATLIAQTDFGNFKKSDSNFDFISVAGEELRILQKGNGPDILLIHGTPGSIEDWSPLIDSLARDNRVTAFDRPGFGYSAPSKHGYTIDKNVDVLESVVKQLNLQNPFYIGHSYGGSMLANLATRGNVADSKIMIVDSPLFGHQVDPALKLMTIPIIGKGMAIISKYTIGPGKIEQGIRQLLVSFDKKQANKFVDDRIKMWLQPKVMYATSNERSNYDLDLKAVAEKYKNISPDIPITILTGTSPKSTLVNDCTKMKQVVPSANLKKFPNCGHYVQFEKRNEVLSIIRSMSKKQLEVEETALN